jgi:hypothetical protein
MGGAKRHTHKYQRGPDGLWHCALPNCTHYMPENVHSQVTGKFSICWECEAVFTLTPILMELKQPKCAGCRIGIDEEELDKYLKEKGV